jgi:molybdate transport system ATP-binding protein
LSLGVSIRAKIDDFTLAVDFQAPPGISALFGPSGAGKTMTLRCISGLTRPESGSIILGERTLFDSAAEIDVPTRSRGVGYVFQQSVLLPHLTVAENTGFGLHLWSAGERARRVEELLERVGLAGYGSRRPATLSGGEQQRVALARALAPQPDLLLLDEPFAALDSRVRRQLRDELRDLHAATGVPMVLVTHDLDEVRQLAGWVAVLERGEVIGSGSLEQILSDPDAAAAAAILRD